MERRREARVLANCGYMKGRRTSPECGMEHRREARVLANCGYMNRSRISPECGLERRREARVLANCGYMKGRRTSPECGFRRIIAQAFSQRVTSRPRAAERGPLANCADVTQSLPQSTGVFRQFRRAS
jgi:glutaredoxin-related protein